MSGLALDAGALIGFDHSQHKAAGLVVGARIKRRTPGRSCLGLARLKPCRGTGTKRPSRTEPIP